MTTDFSFLCKLFGRLVDITMQALIGNMIQLWFVGRKDFISGKKLPKLGKFCNFFAIFSRYLPPDNIFNFFNQFNIPIITLESFIDNTGQQYFMTKMLLGNGHMFLG